MDEPHFGTGEPFSLGLEEELFLVDAGNGRLVNDGPEVHDRLGDLPRGEIKNELHRSQIELITGVCTTVGEAVAELSELRRAVLATGVGVVAAGTHPTAAEGDSMTTEDARYKRIEHLLGDAGATPVCALHIHVGMPDAETAIRAFNGLRRHLPLLEALGANSPFRHGRDTGLASARELTLRSWPRAGTPRAMHDYEDFARSTERLTRVAEVVHALARYEAQADPVQGPPAEVLDEASFRAARAGIDATLPDRDDRLRPVTELTSELVERLRPAARELRCEPELDGVARLVAERGGAGVQRRAYDDGGIAGLLDAVVTRDEGSTEPLRATA
jgi:carboxylate-amine ligase